MIPGRWLPPSSNLAASAGAMRLQRRARFEGQQTVVLTMESIPGFARKALGAGAFGLVSKQFADTELDSAIRALHGGGLPEPADSGSTRGG